MSKDFKGARCADNQEIYEKVKKMKVVADLRKNQNAAYSYKKVLKTLEKYPIPIISIKQAMALDGVGTRIISLINESISSKYSAYKSNVGAHSQPSDYQQGLPGAGPPNNQSKRRSKSVSPGKSLNAYTSKPLKKINDQKHFQGNEGVGMDKEAGNRSLKVSEKCSLLLTSLCLLQRTSLYRKYFTKEEIIGHLHKSELAIATVKPKITAQSFQSLLSQNLICKLDFDTEVKYSLTQDGRLIAEKHLKTEAALSGSKQEADSLSPEPRARSSERQSKAARDHALRSGSSRMPEPFGFKENEDTRNRFRPSNENQLKEYSYQGAFDSQPNSLSVDAGLLFESVSNPPVPKKESALAQRIAQINSELIAKARSPRPNVTPRALSKPLDFPSRAIKSWKLIMYVDNREKGPKKDNAYFTEKLAMSGIDVAAKNLPLGDFFWGLDIETAEGEKHSLALDFIVERKTIDDLASSIFDGRYKDQKRRLKASKIGNVFYLIEGDLTQGSFAGLKTSVNTTRITEKFKVIRSDSHRSTKLFLTKLHLFIKGTVEKSLESPALSFKFHLDDFFKSQQKFSNLSAKNAFMQALKLVRGIGQETAYQLVSIYPTLGLLFSSINDPASSEATDIVLTKLLNKKQKQDLLGLFALNP